MKRRRGTGGETRKWNASIEKMNTQILKQANDRAIADGNDYMQTLLRGMNAKRLTESDIASLNEYLGIPEGTMVVPGEHIPEGPSRIPKPKRSPLDRLL